MITGKWNMTLKAMGQEKSGVLDFDALRGEAIGMELPIENLTDKGNDTYSFSLINQGKEIKFAVKVDGDSFVGKAKFGPMPMTCEGTRA